MAETIAEKNTFQGAFEKRRCLVLADGFYERKGERGSKQPYRIERVDDDPFAFAGLWVSWGRQEGTRVRHDQHDRCERGGRTGSRSDSHDARARIGGAVVFGRCS